MKINIELDTEKLSQKDAELFTALAEQGYPDEPEEVEDSTSEEPEEDFKEDGTNISEDEPEIPVPAPEKKKKKQKIIEPEDLEDDDDDDDDE